MSLTPSNEITLESTRILNCTDNFAILKLNPTTCTVKDATINYNLINNIIKKREAIRNPLAIRAREKLDIAYARLSDIYIIIQEKEAFMSKVTEASGERSRLMDIDRHTQLLEGIVGNSKRKRE
eukprot:Tbor_TRINITY_DN4975_c5_g2::TRINITY_DN4975_c5_g2_i1::g.9950::m.9950